MEQQQIEWDVYCQPEPLTRCNRDGEVYRRNPAVDKQIREILRLDADGIIERTRFRDEASSKYVKEETLVYLIRHFHKAGDRRTVSDLSECLLSRCVAVVYSTLGALGKVLADEGHLDVISELFSKILDLNSDVGDFLQVRFWVVLKRLSVQVFRKLVKRISYESPSVLAFEEVGETALARSTVATGASPYPSPESYAVNRTLIREALGQLKEPIKTAFLLRHYAGWPIEHRDEDVPTISRHFAKTPRTIRNWLATAEEILEEWRGE
ncbi:MAG: hypothetical protein F4034_03280 [Chloroflexi bacterium]|nr:hypothetical protein [Chloroflexota bacterium]